ncbi:MAG TPA: hypothetical protein VEZ55_16490 [Chitinophagaceae bacterium]|nr:hypothetical protein [Chitinophagaceae bacterium]
MQEYIIDVAKVEELQTLRNIAELDSIFSKAHASIVGGSSVVLVRTTQGQSEKFNELSSEEDLKSYKENVYKYL